MRDGLSGVALGTGLWNGLLTPALGQSRLAPSAPLANLARQVDALAASVQLRVRPQRE